MWTQDRGLGLNEREKAENERKGGGSCLNYADVGRNHGGKTATKARLLGADLQPEMTRLLPRWEVMEGRRGESEKADSPNETESQYSEFLHISYVKS